jgi:acetoin utilization protein AcuB
MLKRTVRRYMSSEPMVVTSKHTLVEAHQVMREKGIRHLPVVDEGRLVGVVSQRDLYLLETLRGVDAERELVEEAMTDEPFTVAPDAALEEVVERMIAQRRGSAVVVDGEAVVGIFTSTDAMKALVELLRVPRAGGSSGEAD